MEKKKSNLNFEVQWLHPANPDNNRGEKWYMADPYVRYHKSWLKINIFVIAYGNSGTFWIFVLFTVI